MVRGLNRSQWNEAVDTDKLAANLAQAVEQNLADSIEQLGRASLVLSGGNTPLPFFKQLSKANLDWSKLDVTLADERWVDEQHEDSNAKFVKEHFLTGAAEQSRFISLYREGDPRFSLGDIQRALSEMVRPFSVVILGMGADGHTASLFPETEGLEQALDLDAQSELAILKPSTVPQTRITLTRAALLQSRYRYLHITGQQKYDVLEAALAENDEKPLPIASFFEKHLPPISVYWSP